MIFVEELQALPGFSAEALRKLERFVIFLPKFTTVNVNFAEPEVLAAVVSGLGMADARRVSQASQCRQPVNAVGKIAEAIGGNSSYDLTLLDVKTDYFLVEGNVRYDRMEVKTEALLKRDRGNSSVVVEWQQRK
jgi:general secretion pathway protein K